MIKRIEAGPRMSQAVVHGNTVYLAGEVPDDGTKDITGQTEEVLAKIDKLLAQVGSDKSKLLSAQIFLPDMGDFATIYVAPEEYTLEVNGESIPLKPQFFPPQHGDIINRLTSGLK